MVCELQVTGPHIPSCKVCSITEMPNIAALIPIFEEARSLLALPDNNYDWSSWLDEEQALDEIDHVLSMLRSGAIPYWPVLVIIFAPTGPMQEVSLSSGWGDEFIALANRFDEAMAREL